jgi:VWFA-related protein
MTKPTHFLWVSVLVASSIGWPSQFRSGVDAVSVEVSIFTDRRPVTGLTPADFRLTDDGIPQTIELVSLESAPIDLTLLIDLSSSAAADMGKIRKSAGNLAALMASDDRLRLTTFSAAALTSSPWIKMPDAVRLQLARARGRTAAYDALASAMMRPGDAGRRHLIIGLTDGQDNSSVIWPTRLREIAQRCDCVLQLVTMDRAPHQVETLLRDLAESTGGRLHENVSGSKFTEAFARILEEYRAAYVLRYVPQGVKDAGWHELSVKITLPDSNRYSIHARRGYFRG